MRTYKLNTITAGIDWEVPVVDKFTGKSVGKEKIAKLIESANSIAPELEIGEDIDLLEIRIGMTKSFAELFEKTERAFEISGKFAQKMNALLVPIGYREADYNPAGGHCHFGSIESFKQGVDLYNRFLPFVPAFVAITSASPSLDGRFCSLRVKLDAGCCSRPMTPIDPELGAEHWGTDICIKYPYKSTVELRVCDSQPDIRLVCSIAALYVGLSNTLLSKGSPFEPDFMEYGMNRLNACINGMRSVFIIGGKEIEAAKMIEDYIIPMALDGLDIFGTPPDEFALLRKMCEKRSSPADWMREIGNGTKDPWTFIGEITRVYSRGQNFIEWLDTATAQSEAHKFDYEDILLSFIGVNTQLEYAHQSLPLPRTQVEKIIDDLIEKKLLIRRLGKKNEILLDRTDLLEKYPGNRCKRRAG